jgi:hypothetical protein
MARGGAGEAVDRGFTFGNSGHRKQDSGAAAHSYGHGGNASNNARFSKDGRARSRSEARNEEHAGNKHRSGSSRTRHSEISPQMP